MNAEIKDPSAENVDLSKVLFYKYGVDQKKALHASPSAFLVHSISFPSPDPLPIDMCNINSE